MSYAARNTLFIAAFWALIMALGLFFVYSYQAKEIEAIQKRNNRKQSRIDDLHKMRFEMDALLKEYNHLKELSLGKMGTLAGNESPGETYDYIRRELMNTKSALSINFTYTGQERQSSAYKRKYEIEGEGDFKDLYSLVWFLERGPIFYDVKSLNVDTIIEEEEDTPKNHEINFKMQVWGFCKDEGVEMEAVNRSIEGPDPIAELVSNSMRNRLSLERAGALKVQKQAARSEKTPVAEPPRRETTPSKTSASNLPVITRTSKVLAVTPSSCIVQDDNGKQWRLGPGDKIEKGFLEEIQNQTGKVIFRIQDTHKSELIELSTIP